MNMKTGEMLSNAIMIATTAHFGQFDRGGKPYILHPLTVMHKLRGYSEIVQVAGVLHDVIEDSKQTTYQLLREKGICEEAIDIIRSVTRVPGETEEEFQAKVLAHVGGMLVKREDLRHNSDLRRLKGVRPKDFERNAKYMLFYSIIDARLSEVTIPDIYL